MTAESNEILLRVVDELAGAFERGSPRTWSESKLRAACSSLRDAFLEARTIFFERNGIALADC